MLNENDIGNTSWRNREYAEFAIARAMNYLLDKEQTKRLPASTCKYCYYFESGLAGQAFMEWKCRVCGDAHMHPNTSTPRVCDPCAKKHALCVRCAGDVHMRTRRKATLREDSA